MKKFLLACTYICVATHSINGAPIPSLARKHAITLSIWSRIAQVPKTLSHFASNTLYKATTSIKNIHWQKTNIVLGILAAAGAIWCLTKATKWLLRTSNTKMVQQAEEAITKATPYQSLSTTLINHYGDLNNPTILSQINEDILAEVALAKEAQFNNTPINNFITGMERSIADLERHEALLNKRIQEIQNDLEIREIYNRIRQARGQIRESIGQLRTIHTYITNHRNYFELHANTMHTAAVHGNGQDALQIQAHPSSSRISSYPRIEYAARLDQDLSTLEQALQKIRPAAQSYPRLVNSTSQILTRLSAARNQFVLTPAYTQELRAQEEAARQQAMIEEQRRQTYIQQQQLREQQKANDLEALKQRQKQTPMTDARYQEELQRINNRYSFTGIVDAVAHSLGH